MDLTFSPKLILVPVAIDPDDDFFIAQHSVFAACDLAEAFKAKITLLHLAALPMPGGVMDVDVSGEVYRSLLHVLQARLDRGQLKIDELQAQVKKRGIDVQGRVVDHVDAVPKVIAATALELKADLIVLGSHGRRGLSRLLVGSVAEQMVHLSPVPLLVLHPKNPITK